MTTTDQVGQWIPLADGPEVLTKARRTLLVRLAFGAVLLLLLVACLVIALRLRTQPTSYFANGSAGIVVADFSRSIDPRAYRRMGQLLRTLADSDQRLGLVAFADDGYEMLPPGTRGDEVRPMLRYFQVGNGPAAEIALSTAETPWTKAFLGGTNIGRGLRVARQVLARTGRRGGSVLLVSDLRDSSSDIPLLTQEIGLYRDAGIQLRIVPLFPLAGDLTFFAGLAGPNVFVSSGSILGNATVAEHRSVVGGFPLWLFLAGGVLLLGLAANELLCRRLEWSGA